MAITIVDHDNTLLKFNQLDGSAMEEGKNAIKVVMVTAEFDWKLADVTGLGDTRTQYIRNGFLTVTGTIIATTLLNTTYAAFAHCQGQLKIVTDSGVRINSGENGCYFTKTSAEFRYNAKGLGSIPCSFTYTMSQPTISNAGDSALDYDGYVMDTDDSA